MLDAIGYAAKKAGEPLVPFQFRRNPPGEQDILIEITHCGICHTDLHRVNNDWGGGHYPMVPGHEIVGRVSAVGPGVSRFQVGDCVGVGCMIDSCRRCTSCGEGLEQYCEEGLVLTYNSVMRSATPTYGGYSNNIVVHQDFVLQVPENLDPAAVAPLLCAGITTYSPLRKWGVSTGSKVGIVGLGGLGHLGLKFAKSFGAHTMMFTTSESKVKDAQRLGADQVVLAEDSGTLQKMARTLDFILYTAPDPRGVNQYLELLKRDGTMVLVSLPSSSPELKVSTLTLKRRRLAGSFIGGIAETQEMLDYCGSKGIVSDVEVVPIQNVNQAFLGMERGAVKYRYVIDMSSLRDFSAAGG
ncbi:NAD(P)-dependent alcohol dehydrogenase [Nevskia soli]|uniref:NAD(P)-dependent alcohol dehydrogenase n=1 Tax=Nevskia soli TaxID=418856 RepID=UPI0004A6EDA1|nr:NAD(P)-dependent alcohol dehydrogenase [Nevskia soli]